MPALELFWSDWVFAWEDLGGRVDLLMLGQRCLVERRNDSLGDVEGNRGRWRLERF